MPPPIGVLHVYNNWQAHKTDGSVALSRFGQNPEKRPLLLLGFFAFGLDGFSPMQQSPPTSGASFFLSVQKHDFSRLSRRFRVMHIS
jgi:hypothetical protein